MLTQPNLTNAPPHTPAVVTPSPMAPSWSPEEFIQLSARVAAEPHRVQAAVDLFQCRLISFGMLKQLLDIGTQG
jgi:hypothetical protein